MSYVFFNFIRNDQLYRIILKSLCFMHGHRICNLEWHDGVQGSLPIFIIVIIKFLDAETNQCVSGRTRSDILQPFMLPYRKFVNYQIKPYDKTCIVFIQLDALYNSF